MSIHLDDDILQDFLVEAGEILEQLGEQLVELEQDPENTDILNAVFRGFHTIKGGAGFVNLAAMVELCHRAEDVFNVLRQGLRPVDPSLMDAVLTVLDILNEMFDEVRSGQAPGPATPELLTQLEQYSQPQSAEPPPALEPVSGPAQPAAKDVTDQDFEDFLDALEADAPPGAEAADASGGDEITDEEFETLLDQLHGPGQHGGMPAEGPGANPPPADVGATSADSAPSGGESDTITQSEFETLLDQLHGEGKAPGAAREASSDAPVAPAPASAAPCSSGGSPPAKAKPPVKPQGETTVRVDTARLDEIMNLVGELVLVRNRLSTLKAICNDEELTKTTSNLDMVTAGLQTAVMKTRMQPVKKIFGRFPRVVRDVARSLNKEVELELHGEETDLDKNLVEALADPLVHLVRNAVDHGIELPEEREKVGKPRAGKVVLSAQQEGDHILLTIEDDGKGMDADFLRRKVVEKGLMEAEKAARLSDEEAYNLIFLAGFSTKAEISDISGRGVGMDVVKTRIEQLNGSIEIFSEQGRGSSIRIRVPLTLAILSTLMIVLNGQRFAFPLSGVDEILDFEPDKTSKVEDQEVILIRDKALPIFYLQRWLVAEYDSQAQTQDTHVVVVHVGNQRVGFVVDQLIGQEEVVIKPLSAYLHGLPGFAGATITGDGRIALILDVASLLKAYAR